MNVQTLKLLNGEEIVGDLLHVGDDFIQLTNAVVLQHMIHPETGKQVRVFGDWPALAEPGQTIRIPVTAVMVMPLDAHEELVRQFTMNITGLELPPTTPKILLS